ncbi:MAG TPA: hypothetical protein VFX96_15575 [Pyrinomonadaceae bacterium]|nr:hypothetical protein [Pyrinomonadaceae bacterium]
MTNRRNLLFSFAAALLFALVSTAHVSAQEPWWRGGNDRRDDGYRRSGYLSEQQRRFLRDTARRINDRSRSFQRNLDRALDASRHDDTRREDRVNDEVREFREAAERFRERAGDDRDLSRSVGEARTLLQTASRIDRVVSRLRLDARTRSDWQQIRADLRTVADIYNLRTGDFDNDRDGRGRGRGRGSNNGNWRWPF